ncbi:MAG: glutaredoxin [Candidatus Heimdallarchaeota archaeon]|nr:glutaredoxin [Candidatus Heimdallarchaeota archaeon]
MSVDVDDNIKRQVKEIFKHMENEVSVKLFVDKDKCLTCAQTKEILELLVELAPENKLVLTIFNKEDNPPEIDKYGVKRFPTILLHGDEEYKVVFTGIPSGYEFGSLVEDILDISARKVTLKPENLEKIKKIDKPMHIQVFVTPTCPYCPAAVRMAHKLAMANPNITGEAVEATEFPLLSQKYYVMGVPKTVINEGKVSFEGAYPEDGFVEKVLEAYKEA